MQFEQVTHVVRRVGELLGAQRTARPVRARLTLVDRMSQPPRDELRIADLRRQPDQRRGDLRIEDRNRETCAAAARIRVQQHFEVLACGVQDLELRAVAEHLEQRIELELRQRVDQVAVGVGCDLDQAGLRIVGALAHELGVEREP